MKCQSMDSFPRETARQLQYFFTDIDDTLSTDGRISAEAYTALWQLHDHGIQVVPVTGRPAGWCDMIARMWPVDAVIGENGAFYFAYNRQTRKMKRSYFQSEDERKHGQVLLEEMRRKVLQTVPGCAISADQPFRIADLAVDFCEDVEPLTKTDIQAICDIAESLSLSYKISSIHVNCWYGSFDKLTCLKEFLVREYRKSLDQVQPCIAFIGDSPNDSPMFAELHHSIAVANISRFLSAIPHHPAYITRRNSGKGFQEAVDTILRLRTG